MSKQLAMSYQFIPPVGRSDALADWLLETLVPATLESSA